MYGDLLKNHASQRVYSLFSNCHRAFWSLFVLYGLSVASCQRVLQQLHVFAAKNLPFVYFFSTPSAVILEDDIKDR